jgi:hypothetical protein
MAYGFTVSTELLRLSAGLALFSDCVFVSAQTMRSLEIPVPLASAAASELMKYSVPPRSVAYAVPGVEAGQTVKPGLPFTAPIVSN